MLREYYVCPLIHVSEVSRRIVCCRMVGGRHIGDNGTTERRVRAMDRVSSNGSCLLLWVFTLEITMDDRNSDGREYFKI